MRRYLLLLSLLLLGSTLLASAAEGERPGGEPVPVTVPGEGETPRIFGPVQPALVPIELERLQRSPLLTLAPLDHASDLCTSATPLLMADGTDGDVSTVKEMSTSPSDPLLTCMDGAPQSLQGYRTVWYRFEAPASGQLVISTDFDPSNYRESYDTVVALYHSPVKNDLVAACDSLRMIACNDDSEGFLSKAANFVHQGEWYFVEVADWHLSAEGYELQLSVVLENVEPLWDRFSDEPWEPRSRHMVVTDGTHIYVISGETVVEELPRRTPVISRFNPATGAWDSSLYPVPRPALPGYSRTSAAYLDGNIYIPSGYVGDDQFYWGEHLRYNIATDTWNYQLVQVPWNVVSGGQPYAWAEAVAVPSRNGYYLVGGLLSGDPDPSFPSDANPTGNLLFYSTAANTWNTLSPDMETPRYAHVAGLLPSPQGPLVCVAGGIGKISDNEAVLLRSAECYNLANNTWSEIAPLNAARFSSGSAVGPDGRWYVFGGATVTGTGDDQTFSPVTATEVYDPVSDTWTVLDSRYSVDEPGRAWPRGVFVGDTLWIFGGETVPDAQVVPLIEALYLPQKGSFVPAIFNAGSTIEPNDTFDNAVPIALQQTLQGDFAAVDDFFDVYRFYAPTPGVYQVIVTSIPDGHNYDVYAYNANKYRVGYGESLGNLDELARTLPLVPGYYYAVVVRVFGQATGDTYDIMVRPE